MNGSRYLLNLNSRTIHDTNCTDGRCKLKNIRPENKKFFETFEEAWNFPDQNNHINKKCSFCIK